ncbi:TerB family tellurite resistance protein [Gemmatimonas sp.]|uniref:tellurite resistance TerB family protein n=1 Tax=Gemmatimonas sp. TaxID=1962908 RepID=UPI003562EFA5
MLEASRKLIGDSVPGTAGAHSRVHSPDVRVAACALLVELACADGAFSEAEQVRIIEILQRHFGVNEAGARAMLADAAAANHHAVDHFVFTRQVVKDYDVAQRIVLAELMWQVALADGALDSQESYVMRKLASLLQLEPAFLAQARMKAE